MAELQGQNAGSDESANKTGSGLTTTHKIICICANLFVILALWIILNFVLSYDIFSCPILLTLAVIVALLPILTFFMSNEKCNKMICIGSFIVVLILCFIIFMYAEGLLVATMPLLTFSASSKSTELK